MNLFGKMDLREFFGLNDGVEESEVKSQPLKEKANKNLKKDPVVSKKVDSRPQVQQQTTQPGPEKQPNPKEKNLKTAQRPAEPKPEASHSFKENRVNQESKPNVKKESIRSTTPTSPPVNVRVAVEEKVVEMNHYQAPSSSNKRVNLKQNRKVSVYEPRDYNDCKHIAQALFRNEIVILSFAFMSERQARRVVDFMTGTVFALDGDIQRIGDEVFVCTPANVEIDSSVAKSLLTAHLPNY